VVGAVLLTGGSHVSFPNRIADQQKVTSPTLRGLADGIARQASFGSTKPQVAFYGPESSPAFLVMAYDVGTNDIGAEFEGGVAGFERSSGGTVDRTAETTITRGAVQYECAPFTVSNVQGDLCMWGDDDTTGFVATLSQSPPGISLVQQVHDAVVR
jgi:hypothetical protein